MDHEEHEENQKKKLNQLAEMIAGALGNLLKDMISNGQDPMGIMEVPLTSDGELDVEKCVEQCMEQTGLPEFEARRMVNEITAKLGGLKDTHDTRQQAFLNSLLMKGSMLVVAHDNVSSPTWTKSALDGSIYLSNQALVDAENKKLTFHPDTPHDWMPVGTRICHVLPFNIGITVLDYVITEIKSEAPYIYNAAFTGGRTYTKEAVLENVDNFDKLHEAVPMWPQYDAVMKEMAVEDSVASLLKSLEDI